MYPQDWDGFRIQACFALSRPYLKLKLKSSMDPHLGKRSKGGWGEKSAEKDTTPPHEETEVGKQREVSSQSQVHSR